MRNIVIMIPARLGSKRIPMKNIRIMHGKPLIQYPIDLAKKDNRRYEIWVNTEEEDLGKAACKLGASFHKRPVELAGDNATNRDFTYEFLQKHDCDYVIMLNTTSPLLRQETYSKFIDLVGETDADTILSVVSEKEETFFQGKPLNFSLEEKINSQFLEPTRKIVWAMTAWKRTTFMSLQERGKNPVFGGKIELYEIPKDESCDLDTEADWRIAEGILQSRSEKRDPQYMEL